MCAIRNAIVRYEFKMYLALAFMDLCTRVCKKGKCTFYNNCTLFASRNFVVKLKITQ